MKKYSAALFCLVVSGLLLSPLSGSAVAGDNAPRQVKAEEDKDTSVEQLFEEMKTSFRADRAKGLHIRYQFRFREPQASDRWIIVNDGTFTMGKGVIEHPDVTFSCTGADWLELSNDTLSGFRAFVTGRLHVKGSQGMARKLDDLFP